ncbi:hypothetical protein PFISCL1PPCAC_5915, partial [Pristionchus fissidentatus]
VNNLFGTIAGYVEKLKQYTYPEQTSQQKTQATPIPAAVAVSSNQPSSQNSQSSQYHTVPEPPKDDSVKKTKTAKMQADNQDDGQYINCAEMSAEELKKQLNNN